MRVMLMIIGIISLVLGIIGIFLPLLPTTPFLLLSAACFAKSSKKFYRWLLENKYFGEYIRNYKEKRGIPIKVKIYSCSLLWATILFSVIFVIDSIIIKFVLVIIALIVSYHILSLKTLK
ncbi:MAG: YbaN family protein [Ignavibacteria bacterium]|nr:YbaN family protein [Ignavibacteria bacterium]